MRLKGDPCPICAKPMTALDSTRNIEFHGQSIKLHHRCWYENQDLIASLETNYPTLDLHIAFQKHYAEM